MITALGLVVGFLGCHGIGSGLYPVYIKPDLPQMRLVECQQHMQCLPEDDYSSLREYSIKMEGLVDKYEEQTRIINGDF